MRTIGVVTTSRADYGIYRPVLRRIESESGLDLAVLVTGMHLAPEFGFTVGDIEADGFRVAARVEMLLSSDSPAGVAKSMGLGITGFAQVFDRWRPDILLVLGDRFEMYASALAALPFKIPIAHIHGGDVTEGAMDDALRHSLTKLAHLHFVATEEYGRRVRQMGEEPWRITVCGSPGLDNIHSTPLLGDDEMEDLIGLPMEDAPLLVTFHPVTMEYERTDWQVTELLAALDTVNRPMVFTRPNADVKGRTITHMIERYAARQPRTRLVTNLGTQAYFTLMSKAAAMVGNSSSGIIEAPSFRLPVVNIGIRQKGRVRARNVIDVGYERDKIVRGIKKALSPSFRKSLSDMTNPYGDGQAAEPIVSMLRNVPLDQHLIIKRFADSDAEDGAGKDA